MNPSVPLDSRARSRLFLHAVMPCVAELVHSVAEAKEEARKIVGTIQMRLIGGPAVALHFEDGRITVQLIQVKSPLIDLVFINDGHLNSYCSGQKWKVPLVLKGLFKMKELQSFSKISDLLEWYMKPKPELLQDPTFRRIYTRLTFTVMARGLPPLAEFDPPVRAELVGLPRGMAHFTMESEGLSLWMEWLGEEALADLGWPSRVADVELDFGSIETALAAMEDQLDAQVALGLGQMRMNGLVPLADGLNLVLGRMRDYLM